MENTTIQTSDLQVSLSVRIAETQDGAVLLDVAQGLCFNINPVGALIWRHIREGRDSCEIAQHLVRVFDISSEQARSDVQEFVDDLKRKQLVHERDGTANHTSRRRSFADMLSGYFPKLFRSRAIHRPE